MGQLFLQEKPRKSPPVRYHAVRIYSVHIERPEYTYTHTVQCMYTGLCESEYDIYIYILLSGDDQS